MTPLSGSVPASDVILMAFLKWDWVIRVEDHQGQPSWCEFSVSDMEGGIKRRKREPVQLSLFDALTGLDQNMDTLKKSVGRVEFEIKRPRAATSSTTFGRDTTSATASTSPRTPCAG